MNQVQQAMSKLESSGREILVSYVNRWNKNPSPALAQKLESMFGIVTDYDYSGADESREINQE